MLKDLDTAAIDEKLKATLRFLKKVTLEPGALGPEDVRPLQALGLSRQEVEDALAVAFFFNVITRHADAFGWALQTEAGRKASAGFLLGKGYLMPMRAKPVRPGGEA